MPYLPMATTIFQPMAPYRPSAVMLHNNPYIDPVDFDGDGNEGWDGENEFDEMGYIDDAYGAYGGVSGRLKRRKKLQAKVKKAKAEGKTAKAKKLQYRLDKLEAKMKVKGDPGIQGAKKPAKKKPSTKGEKAKAKKEEEDDDAEDAREAAEDDADDDKPGKSEAAQAPAEASDGEGGGSNKGLLIGGGLAAVGLLAGLAFLAMRKKE